MNLCGCCAEAAPYCLITALSDSRRSNNGTGVEMSQLTAHRCHAEHDTWDGHLNKWTGYLILICMLWFSHYCVSCIKCASHLYCTERERWQTGGQLVATVPAMYLHLPQYLRHMSGSVNMARCPHTFTRRVREWRMRWHLHVSVCSLMTQRSFLSHTLSLSSLLCSLSLSFSGHLVCLLAPQLICLGTYPNLILLLPNSSIRQFPLWTR